MTYVTAWLFIKKSIDSGVRFSIVIHHLFNSVSLNNAKN
ncbi:hypothetical protein AOT82_784 [Psychrobacter sp. AntiMn-1]|nr:hypothetical protein AOT82_784 [Psychrobacter sp. AntiMn-1]